MIKRLFWLSAFSVAMGYLEAAVVVYLRLHYYPNGFGFPLVPLEASISSVEIFREAATVIMLLGVGVLTGENFNQRLAFFLLAFAVWDLFYYVFLKVILDWPQSWFTWDILFLIPAPWVGPVLSAVIVAFTMIVFAAALLLLERKRVPGNQTQNFWKISKLDWILILVGSLTIVISWMYDFIKYSGRVADLTQNSLQILATYIPDQFNWWIFWVGELMLIFVIGRMAKMLLTFGKK